VVSVRAKPALPLITLMTELATTPMEALDEPCGDVGTFVDPEPANNLPDVQRASAFTPRSKNSPLRDQYLALKANYRNFVLFFRLGDFYELFDEDAGIAWRELDLVLTNRPVNANERVPMCGVPYHAVESYIEKLTAKGYNVAVVEQVSEPTGKGLVEREVNRLILAPMVNPVEPEFLDCDGAALRLNDWVETLEHHVVLNVPVGISGAIVGFKGAVVIVSFPTFKSTNGDPIIDYYSSSHLKRIEPPEPKDAPPINYNGGLTDVALVALAQADIERVVIEIHVPDEPVQPVSTEAAPEAPVVISPETLAAYPAIALFLEGESAVGMLWEHATRALAIYGDLTREPEQEGEIAASILYEAFCSETLVLADLCGHGHGQVDALSISLPVKHEATMRRWCADLANISLSDLEMYAQDQARNFAVLVAPMKAKITPKEYRNERYGERVRAGVCMVTINGQAVDRITHDPINGKWVIIFKDLDQPVFTDDLPVLVVTPAPLPVPTLPAVPAPVANSAGAIRLHLGGVLRVGTVYAIANAADGYFEVLFLNPVPKPCIEMIERHYDIQQTPNKSFLRVRPKGIGADVFAQTEAVLAAEIEPTADLLDEAAERKLIESFMVTYPDLNNACFGVTQFLANVIARLQREAAGVLVQSY